MTARREALNKWQLSKNVEDKEEGKIAIKLWLLQKAKPVDIYEKLDSPEEN